MYQRLRKSLRASDGLTLIELIVVVAILGILAVILTPRVLGAMDNAKTNSAMSTGKQLQVAMERYTVDHNGYPAVANLLSTCSGTSCTAAGADLATLLADYVNLDKTNIGTVVYTPDADKKGYTLAVTLVNPAKTITVTPTTVQ